MPGLLVGWLIQTGPVEAVLARVGLGYVDRTPSAWDYAMDQPEGSWVKVRLKDDGGEIAGLFGRHSFAALDPNRADVDFEQVWRLDEAGTFAGPIAGSEGVWIAHDVIAYIEFLGRPEETDGPTHDIGGPSDSRRHDSSTIRREPGSLQRRTTEAEMGQARRPARTGSEPPSVAPEPAAASDPVQGAGG